MNNHTVQMILAWAAGLIVLIGSIPVLGFELWYVSVVLGAVVVWALQPRNRVRGFVRPPNLPDLEDPREGKRRHR